MLLSMPFRKYLEVSSKSRLHWVCATFVNLRLLNFSCFASFFDCNAALSFLDTKILLRIYELDNFLFYYLFGENESKDSIFHLVHHQGSINPKIAAVSVSHTAHMRLTTLDMLRQSYLWMFCWEQTTAVIITLTDSILSGPQKCNFAKTFFR